MWELIYFFASFSASCTQRVSGMRTELPDVSQIRATTREKLGRSPCLWQCETALALLRGDRDIICISGTGSGKTLVFWIPLLFRPQGVQVIITPLNLLGTQNVDELKRSHIAAIAISGDCATFARFKVGEFIEVNYV